MKILNLIQCLNLGGMEQASYILMQETHKKNIDWQIQSVTPAGVGKEIIAKSEISISDNSYDGKFGYKSHLALRKKISNFSGDIILVTGPTLTGCWSVKSHPCKKVLSIHFCHKSGLINHLKWKTFYNYFHNDYNAIIYHSPYILEEAKRIAPHIQDKFHLIENSVSRINTTTLNERKIARQYLNIPTNAFVIGNAGWLIERKQFDIFLKVCSKLCKFNKDLIFVIAGDGPLRQDLEALAVKWEISDKIKWIGWQKDLNNFYQSLDLLLFNSNSDALGRTILEAMGYGVPVVASVLEGGTDSIIIHKKNGYLIQEHNIDLLIKYCLELMNNENIYQLFQKQSLEMLKTRFSNELFVQRHLDVFNTVVQS
jgi:glycosyltransferase involved in cell wall biosynthesis